MLIYILIASIIIILFIYFTQESTRRCTSSAQMNGKTIIVTGAAIGIGYQVTKDLARRGARVIMGCINVQLAEKVALEISEATGNSNIRVIPLDLASFHSVRKFAEIICEEEECIYALVHNAGLTLFKHLETEDKLDTVMQVNFFSPFLLTNLLLDKLVAGQPSRVVFVSSMAHKISGKLHVPLLDGNVFNTFKQYGNSKLCQIYFCQHMAQKMTENVTFNAVHPGTVNTNFFQNFPLPSVVQAIAGLVGKTPEDGAQTVIFATVDEGLERVTGKYFDNCRVSKPSIHASDEEMQLRVIEAAESIIDYRR